MEYVRTPRRTRSSRDRGKRERLFYAKIDEIEPSDEGRLLVVFSAINARSDGLWNAGPDSYFAIHNNPDDSVDAITRSVDQIRENVTKYWDRAFDYDFDTLDSVDDPLSQLSICRITIVIESNHSIFQVRDRFNTWFRIRLDEVVDNNPRTTLPSIGFALSTWHYGFQWDAAQLRRFIDAQVCSQQESAAMEAVLYAQGLHRHDASISQLEIALKPLKRMDQCICFNVGQGLCVGLADCYGRVLAYSDYGHGLYSKGGGTTPHSLRYCRHESNPAPVILSHWHFDHYAGAYRKVGKPVKNGVWVLPPVGSSLRPGSMRLVKTLIDAKCTILPFPNLIKANQPATMTITTQAGQKIALTQCTGSLTGNPNECGIAVNVENTNPDGTLSKWVLPGDASYDSFIDPFPNAVIAAVVAAHHGGKISPFNLPQRPNAGYARLLFSFGKDNNYGIPCTVEAATRSAYQKKQWVFPSNWTNAAVKPPLPSYVDVLSTATWEKKQPVSPTAPITHIAATWTGQEKVDDSHLQACFTMSLYKNCPKQTFRILR